MLWPAGRSVPADIGSSEPEYVAGRASRLILGNALQFALSPTGAGSAEKSIAGVLHAQVQYLSCTHGALRPQDSSSTALTPPCSSAPAPMVLYASHGLDAAAIMNARNLSYSEVACVAVLTWDVLVTLTDEVELIWKRRWTAAKFMYLIARYLPWLVQLALLAINVNGTTGLTFTFAQCAAWQIVQGILLQVIVTTVDVILVIRANVTPRLQYNDECYVTSSPPNFQYYWVISLAFETLLFFLTIVKFLDGFRNGWARGVFVQQFITDGTWAYALIFLVMLVNMMLYKYIHSTLTGICYTWLLVVLSFAGSRLVLFPRSRAAPPDEDMMSDIELIHVPTERRESAYGRDPGLRISFPPAEPSPISPASEKGRYIPYLRESEPDFVAV
ncbi:hypothetical protein GSI_12210 [Ganoderma sinense ZZ0214-1]|uniref:DUF6533 domain-containing protein n=1 Tax=Ganoderma sinense ZZ0214-1 TaxID=1077348 RepID=A0A2G8RY68_9APHY|nr:hypothetical protein GSI_12210 [Ganoderma sinense ZZ0214-1]